MSTAIAEKTTGKENTQASEEKKVELEAPVEQTTEEAQASVLAGYNRKPGDEPPALEEETRKELFAGMTEEEVVEKLKAGEKAAAELEEARTTFSERMQKLNNQVGNIMQQIAAIPKGATKTEAREITAAGMVKLKELGLDDVAEALAEDLKGVGVGGVSIDVEAVVAKALSNRATMELDELHPDRHEVIKTPEFTEWLDTLSETRREKLLASESLPLVSRELDNFKGWLEKKQEAEKQQQLEKEQQEKEQKQQQTQAQTGKQERLQSAIAPTKGQGSSSSTVRPDEDGYKVGYYKGAKK